MSDRAPSVMDDQTRMLAGIAAEALRHWAGEFGEPSLIKFRENAVFSVRNSQDQAFALRIHRPGYHSAQALDSELAWMNALAASGLHVPHPQASLTGHYSVAFLTPDARETRYADLLEWLDGETLSAIEDQPDSDEARVAGLYRNLGETAGRLHEHGASWSPPAGFHRHHWDAEGLTGDAPIWGPFWDLEWLSRAEAALIREARAVLAEDLGKMPRDPSCYGLIHADLLSDNVVVQGSDIRLIDFDDAGWGWHMFELATALHFQIGNRSFEAKRDALFTGYRSTRDVPGNFEEQLPLFLLARSVTYLGWVATRQETETARQQTRSLIERCCDIAQAYLAQRRTHHFLTGQRR
ncbi:phosphotransferase enzyme family protein [Sphingobium sp. DC-2]|uniref:phosphotransferase enzyme family protein n=1 Tax=Sphingobium sp. DC-2 TaxID=1303256 RepID=UPI00068D2FB4|nr:phosphotransferase [Sphingobium sp. DC-2]